MGPGSWAKQLDFVRLPLLAYIRVNGNAHESMIGTITITRRYKINDLRTTGMPSKAEIYYPSDPPLSNERGPGSLHQHGHP